MQTEGLLGGPGPTGMGLREGGPQSRVGVAELLEQVLTQGASDLHLTAGAKPTVRVNGRPRLGRGRVPADPPGDQAPGGPRHPRPGQQPGPPAPGVRAGASATYGPKW